MSVFKDRNGYWRDGWLVTVWATVVVAVIVGFTVGVRTWCHHYDAHNCGRYAVATGRPVKFSTYSYWKWECLTPNPSQEGTWIPTGQLVGVR